jgi:hypothetical protein
LLTEFLVIRSEGFFKVRFYRNKSFFVCSQDFKAHLLKIFIVQKLKIGIKTFGNFEGCNLLLPNLVCFDLQREHGYRLNLFALVYLLLS